METADVIVRDIGEVAARLAVWRPRTLSERTQDLGRVRDLLLAIEREVLAASAATVGEVAGL